MSTNTALWSRKEQSIDAKFFKWGSVSRIFLNLEKKIDQYEIFEFDSQYGLGKYIKIKISLDGEIWELKLLKVDSVRLTSALKRVSDSIEKFPHPIMIIRTGYGQDIQYESDKVKKKT